MLRWLKLNDRQKLIQYRTSLVNVIRERKAELENLEKSLRQVDRDLLDQNDKKQGMLFKEV